MSDDAERRLADLLRRNPGAPTALTPTQRELIIAESRRIWFRNQAARRRWWWTTLIAATFVAGMTGWLLRAANEPTASAPPTTTMATRDRAAATGDANIPDDLKDQRGLAGERLAEQVEKSREKKETGAPPITSTAPAKPAASATLTKPAAVAKRDQPRPMEDGGKAANFAAATEQAAAPTGAPKLAETAAPAAPTARRPETDKSTNELQRNRPDHARTGRDQADTEAGPMMDAMTRQDRAITGQSGSAAVTAVTAVAADTTEPQPTITITANATGRPRLLPLPLSSTRPDTTAMPSRIAPSLCARLWTY